MSLGLCRTRTIAERAAAEKLEQLGINFAQTFIETTSNITFQQQAEIWLKSTTNPRPSLVSPLSFTQFDMDRAGKIQESLALPPRGLEDPPYAQRFGNSPCLGDTAPRAEWSIAVRDLTQRPKAVCLNLFRKRFKET